MYELSVKTRFSAAHCLVGYDGRCAARHGHNWEVVVFVKGRKLDKLGMLIDFHALKQIVRDALEELDHTDLNALKAFTADNPSSENIARYLFGRLRGRLKGTGCAVDRVTVAETPENLVTYFGERHE